MVNFETAHSLEEAFVYATEVDLATLCELCMARKTPHRKIERQRSICLGMLRICRRAWVTAGHVDWGHSRQQRNFPRVSELIANKEPEAIEGALDRLILTWGGHAPAASAPLLVARTG